MIRVAGKRAKFTGAKLKCSSCIIFSQLIFRILNAIFVNNIAYMILAK